MEDKEVIKYLNQIQDYNCMIDRKREMIEGLVDRLENVSYSFSNTGIKTTSRDLYSQSHIHTQIVDYQKEVENDISVLIQKIKDITSKIDMINEPTLKTILYFRYVDGMQWEKIADKMLYSERNCYYYHKNAIKRMGVILDKNV